MKKNLEFMPVGRAKDITGKKFGRLTVLGRAPSNTKYAKWWCECECGNIIQVIGSHLSSGVTKSCGCLNKEIVSEIGKFAKKDLIGEKFNYLTVIKDSGKRAHNRNIIWLCQCDCGNMIEVRGDLLKSNHTTSCGCRKNSMGEEKIIKILSENKIPFIKEYSPKNFHFNNNSQSHPRFDFYLEEQNIIIEFDGKQHFVEASGFHSNLTLKERQVRDAIKTKYCQDNKIKLIRIPYTDIEKISKKYLKKLGVQIDD